MVMDVGLLHSHPCTGSGSMVKVHWCPPSHRALLVVVVNFPFRINIVIQVCVDKVLQPSARYYCSEVCAGRMMSWAIQPQQGGIHWLSPGLPQSKGLFQVFLIWSQGKRSESFRQEVAIRDGRHCSMTGQSVLNFQVRTLQWQKSPV